MARTRQQGLVPYIGFEKVREDLWIFAAEAFFIWKKGKSTPAAPHKVLLFKKKKKKKKKDVENKYFYSPV